MREQFKVGQKVWAVIVIPTEAREESYAARVLRKLSDDRYICSIWDKERMFLAEELTPMDEEPE